MIIFNLIIKLKRIQLKHAKFEFNLQYLIKKKKKVLMQIDDNYGKLYNKT